MIKMKSKTKTYLKICKNHGIEPDTYDVNSKWDSSLKNAENWKIIEDDIKEKTGTIDFDIESEQTKQKQHEKEITQSVLMKQ